MSKDPQSQAAPLPSLHFLPWEQPLAEGVAKLLIDQATEGAARDLSEHMVIVPSQFASRLLTEKLAQAAGERGVFLPRITTPSRFLNWGDEQHSVASEEHILLTWVKILTSIDRSGYSSLFAGGQAGPFEYEAALDFAKDLIDLRDELAGTYDGLNFQLMADKAMDLKAEPDRWSDLSRLEEIYEEELKLTGKSDHNTLRKSLAKGTGHPEGIRFIWLAGVLAPQPLLLRALTGILERNQAKVNVVIGGGSAELFDEWGQPLPEAWKERRIPWNSFSECVHVVPKQADAHTRLIGILRKGAELPTQLTPGTVSIVPCDRENEPTELEYSVRRATGATDTATANALGEPHKNHEIHYGLRTWLAFLTNPCFGTLRNVALHPTLARAIAGGKNDFLTNNYALDALSVLHPPADLEEAEAFCRLQVENVREEAAKHTHESKHRNADDAIVATNEKTNEPAKQTAKTDPAWKLVKAGEIIQTAQTLCLSHRQMAWHDAAKAMVDLCSDENPDDLFGDDVADNFIKIVERLESSVSQATKGDTLSLLKLAIDTAGESRYRGDINPNAINLPGWQDAPWEPAPHLIVFGMNDNFVPGSKAAHPYLPASLRRALGLLTPESNFANAAFIFEQLWRRRLDPKTGRLDIIVPQFSNEGEGLKPSRLLFLSPIDPTADDEDALLGPKGRIGKLFKELPQDRTLPYWEIPTGCRFDPAAPPDKAEKIRSKAAATDLRAFINNGPAYWMKKALRMRDNDHGAIELSPTEFGVLVHSAMEEFKATGKAGQTTDSAKIKKALIENLEAIAEKRLGTTPPAALRNQLKGAAERMAWLAAIEAEISKEWETVFVEGELPEHVIKMEDKTFTLHGRFDRLDRHKTDRNLWRVYDYKTTNSPKTPKEAHVALFKSNNKADLAYVKESDKSDYRWKDVQLVVYEWCLLEGEIKDEKLKEAIKDIRNGKAKVEVAYINITNNRETTRLEPWDGFELFKEGGRKVIIEAAMKLASGKPEAFTEAYVTSEGEKYPILPGLSKRNITDYMIGDNFGKSL